MRLRKIALIVLAFLAIFCMGFILSDLSYTARYQQTDEQIGDFHQHVYLFDTEQKIADHYKTMETKQRPEYSFARQAMARRGRDQPLVTAGPFTIFVNNDTGEFSVHESQSPMDIVKMAIIGQTKFLRLNGLLEEGRSFPRFGAVLSYSVDSVYKRGSVSLSDDNRTLRTFVDSKGIGAFDTMEIWENNVKTDYRLNGLTWERDEGPPLVLPPPPGSRPSNQ